MRAAERVRRAARPDCSALLLQELARDPEIIVRATVALNRGCGEAVDSILVADRDERVRALLGGRIARLLPGLGDADQDQATAHVHAMLAMLANDQAIRVRAAIAEEIATMSAAPRALVLQLARDAVGEVSDQIVRLSPVLSDADLLAILATPHPPNTAESIASRPKLSAVVADAIVQRAEAPAIRALLANRSACIRETTLDALIGRAPSHLDWHAPLVRRPGLSTQAVRALSEFIAADLLRILASRVDLEAGELELVRQRLAASGGNDERGRMEAARTLAATDGLNEAAFLDAIRHGDQRQALAFLAVSSGVTLQTIDRLIEFRSAKALVSLVWRSGFGMGLAVTIQTALAQFGPDTLIRPTATGGFPLSEDEMSWQIELMAEPESAA